MKRKVIKQGHNTLTVTLPSKWCSEHNIQPGKELDLTVEDDKLIVHSQPAKENLAISVDITGMDRCSILYIIRNAYRMGYSQIELSFDNTTTMFYETLETVTVLSVIHFEVNHLVGPEIVNQTKNYCLIKDLSSPEPEEFGSVLRRIFLMLINAADEFVLGIKTKDFNLVETIEEKHDTITKFVSYCLRLVNKGNGIGYKHHALIYHIIANLDKIADVLKYSSRAFIVYHKDFSKDAIELIKQMLKSLRLYYEFFYKYDLKKSIEIDKNRDDVLGKLKTIYKKLSKEEMLVITNMEQMLELLADLVVARMGLS